MKQTLDRHVAVLIVLVLLLILVGIFSSFSRGDRYRTDGTGIYDNSAESVQLSVPPAPSRTKHMQEVVDASHGFSHFISYTDNGFEPSDVTIKRGQTVRFTNNSSRALWIMSSAGEGGVYPSGENACDQTAFDTCLELPPNDIWEFTFDVSGSWSYSNNMNKTDVAVIHVK